MTEEFMERRNRVRKLEKEIEEMLNEHPEYREWFDEVQAEIDRVAGDNKMNRLAEAMAIMMRKWSEIIPANDGLQGEFKEYCDKVGEIGREQDGE